MCECGEGRVAMCAKMREVKAVLFDLDGVLVDSFESWRSAFNAMLRKYRKKELSVEEFREKCWGPELHENLKKFGLDASAGEFCLKEQLKHIEHVKLFPKVREVLRSLRECGFKLGLVTNTPRENTLKILAHFKLHFDVVVTRDDVRAGKPNAEMVLSACKKLSLRPENAILVGDTESDFLAGKNAGCLTVAFNANGGDLKIERLEDLLRILNCNKRKGGREEG